MEPTRHLVAAGCCCFCECLWVAESWASLRMLSGSMRRAQRMPLVSREVTTRFEYQRIAVVKMRKQAET